MPKIKYTESQNNRVEDLAWNLRLGSGNDQRPIEVVKSIIKDFISDPAGKDLEDVWKKVTNVEGFNPPLNYSEEKTNFMTEIQAMRRKFKQEDEYDLELLKNPKVTKRVGLYDENPNPPSR